MTETCGGGGGRPGRGPGRRIKAGRMAAGAGSADRGVAVGAPLNRQWDRVKGAGMEVLPIPELQHRDT